MRHRIVASRHVTSSAVSGDPDAQHADERLTSEEHMRETDLLRELHDAYVWKVNAAVAEDRMDLVWEFVDAYTDEALQLMAALESRGCDRPDCAVCTGGGSGPALPSRRRWFSWRRRRGGV